MFLKITIISLESNTYKKPYRMTIGNSGVGTGNVGIGTKLWGDLY